MNDAPPLDPNRHAYRPDLADRRLEGRVDSARFVSGEPAWCRVGVAALRGRPGTDSEQASQLLWGEEVAVFERRDGWAWVQGVRDGYVGYVAEEALGGQAAPAAHRVVALRSFLYPAPGMKRPPLDALPFMSRVRIVDEAKGYLRVEPDGWLYARHVAPADALEPDFVATACRFVGVPYLWGGLSALGIDCSGLVQIALAAAGIAAPRDTYMQAAELGAEVADHGDTSNLRRGDLVFFPGHVGLLDGSGGFVHANGHDGMVSVHRLDDVLARERTLRGNGISVVRRPPPPPEAVVTLSAGEAPE